MYSEYYSQIELNNLIKIFSENVEITFKIGTTLLLYSDQTERNRAFCTVVDYKLDFE